MSIKSKRILLKFKRIALKIIDKVLNADWSDPLNILYLATVLIIPFVARQYFLTGLLLGLLLTISILWTIQHCPLWIKRLIVANPILSDFILSAIALLGVGSLFGSGLTLGIGAVVCGILIGFCIPGININPRESFV